MPTEYHYQLPRRGKLSDAQISWVTWELGGGEELQYTTHLIPQGSIPLKLYADSIHEYKGPSTINVHKLEMLNETDHGFGEGFSSYSVVVYHDGGEGSAAIYTDKAVPHYISMWLQLPLEWSEYGMQCDGAAHLEINPQHNAFAPPKTEYSL